MTRCPVVIGVVGLDPPALLDLKSHLDVDPAGPSVGVYAQDFVPERFVQAARRGQKVTFVKGPRLLSHHDLDLTEGARIEIRILCEDQEGERLSRFEPVGRVCDDLGLAFLEQTEEILESVMSLGIEENGQPPHYVAGRDQ